MSFELRHMGKPIKQWDDKNQRNYALLVKDQDKVQKSVKTILKSIKCSQVADRVKGVAEAKPINGMNFFSSSAFLSSGTNKELKLEVTCSCFHP
jgi:hypothetical protein